MKALPENILSEAVDLLSQGAPLDRIYELYPQHESELREVLPMAELLVTTPKNAVPSPTQRYRFAEKKNLWQKLSQLFVVYQPIAIPAMVVILLLAGGLVTNITRHSLPGDTLFPLRVAGEKTRLSLTFDQEKIANLHVQLAQKRIDDARKAIENSDPKQEAAALGALTEQTEKTISAVSHLAANKAISEKDSTLLNNLVSINKEQKTLLAAATQSEQTKDQAASALDESKENDMNLAKLIATVNEQELLDLPNKISITGIVPTIAGNKVVLEKNLFIINDNTILISTTGEVTANISDIKGKITVIGTRENNTLVAKKIIVIDPNAIAPVEPNPAVKGITSPPQVNTVTPHTTPITPTEPAEEPEATAGFIAEPSNSQDAE